jgi:high-affinity iron transporter
MAPIAIPITITKYSNFLMRTGTACSRFLMTLFCCFACWAAQAATDAAVEDKARQIWQLLDYVAVDYGEAVSDGKVTNDDEYAEMQEFAHAAQRQLADLPDTAGKTRLLENAQALRTAIGGKAAATVVAQQARDLAGALLASYPVAVAPARAPDLQLGARLYQAQCVSCHGASGRGDGPLAARLDPPPIALSDPKRARERSVFSLQQIITRGVDGTSMPGFAALTDDERWALAFFASTLSYSDQERQAGATLWAAGKTVAAAVPTLAALTQTTEAALAAKLPADQARAALAYLRSQPQALENIKPDTIALAKSRLRDSLGALEKGDAAAASRLALSAYLDGFEPVEPALAAKNKFLFEEIEKSMGLYRGAVTAGKVDDARAIEARLQALLAEAQEALGMSSEDPLAIFVGALTILLREGLEALLVVVAVVAFLTKAGRRDVLPYVHAGWIAALAAGGATWVAATYLVEISGASRELTEGFSAVCAAIVLLAVGIWMHQKSIAGRWQAYVKQKLSAALDKRSAVMLFVLSFVTVYREVFETILFYAALWSEGNGIYLLGGLGAGILLLAVAAVILLRTSARLPISQFFAASSALVAVLAVVLIGKGVGALQKAGIFETTPLALPRIDFLGIYPSLQTVLAQLLVVAVIVASIAFNMRSRKRGAA